MKKALYVLSIVFLISVMFGMAGCGLFGGKSDTGGSGGGSEKTITISIAEEGKVGEKVLLEKQANFTPFYQKNILYEFIGENTCLAEFSHELEDNWWNTYIIAKKSGEATIQLSYIQDDAVVAKSNSVTIRITANTIGTVEELKAIAGTDQAYELSTDIDLSSEENWTPIEGFTGELNGCGHSIVNLTINSVNNENVGLFSVLRGKINDLMIENVQISHRGDTGNIGILAGTCSGTVQGVQVSGTIDADYAENVGGIVGYLDNGSMKENTNLAEVNGGNSVGGIAGYASIEENNAIDGNINQGKIIGKENAGGIAGTMTCFSDKSTKHYTYAISDLINEGEVEGITKVGGIFGQLTASSNKYYGANYSNYFTVSLLSNKGTVTASGDYAGGLIGFAERTQTLSVSENTADIQGANFVGGFVGYSADIQIDCDGFVNNSMITGKGIIGGIAGQAGIISDAENAGLVISESVYIANNESYAYAGGIAGIAKGVINCVNTVDIVVSHAGKYTGGIVGKCVISEEGTFTGNRNDGDITGAEGVGGIAGMITCPDKGTTSTDVYDVSNNENNGIVEGTAQVGGIIGYADAVRNLYYGTYYNNYFALSACKNNGEIVSEGDYAGGIVGYALRISTATLCENYADVTGGSYTGGLFGSAEGANIKAVGVENANVITGKSYVGGFAGYAGIVEDAVGTASGSVISLSATVEDGEQVAYAGGIAGYCTGLIGCVNSADIEVRHAGRYVAGLAGYLYLTGVDQVKNNKNEGNISGTEYVGGIAGYVFSPGREKTQTLTYSLTDNKNFGQVQSSGYAGGITAYVYAARNNYWGTYYYNKIQVTNSNNEGRVFGSVAGGIVGGYYYLDTSDAVMGTNFTSYGNKLGQ